MTDTSTNRAIVEDFARIFYAERDVAGAFAAHVSADYIQHNPNILDGPQAAVDALKDKFSADGARFDVMRILVDDDLALIHLRATRPGAPAAAVADIYRLEGGKVVEHWDVLQAVPADAVNPKAMF
ncbi:nuclear transport factor 2 family protein [Naasia lichenicola]|uniref:Polyketide cyclase n=1 Tax=Naasia lichenicola TaxID=2565933 RepID=A0A4S4FN24_9MICO|nr:nuclear transport factor 2 family protein [Naasia lichenicola]THG31658.1 polyketide cyclase [Naasia lichenicola]